MRKDAKTRPVRIPRALTKPKLTRKQAIFVDEYIKTENGTQSALKAYDTTNPTTASVIAVENLSKPIVIEVIEEKKRSIAERLDDNLLLNVHLEGLKASDEIIVDGKIVAKRANYAVRHKYLDTAYKLRGLLIDKSLNVNVETSLSELAEQALKLNDTSVVSLETEGS
jgi:predicted RNA-binding protein with PUA domain